MSACVRAFFFSKICELAPLLLSVLGGRCRMVKNLTPWDVLDAYRGTFFKGKWPTLPELFELTVHRFPDRLCWSRNSPTRKTWTYTQARQSVLNVAADLRRRGIGTGMRVGITGKNSPEWAIALMGVLRAGATAVPVDAQLSSENATKLFGMAEVALIFADTDKVKSLEGSVPVLPLEPLGEFWDQPEPSKYNLPDIPSDTQSIAVILFTSGTTGAAKGAMLTHENLVSDCFLAQTWLPLFETDVFYALLPIHHSYCLQAVFLESLSVGAHTLFAPQLIVSDVLRDMKTSKVTMFLGVPLLFNKLLKGLMKGVREKGLIVYGLVRFLMAVSGLVKKLTGLNLGRKIFHGLLDRLSLGENRVCISGGGPLPASTFKMFNQLGVDFVQGYGLTETSPILTLNPQWAYKEKSVGRLLPEVDLKIKDPDMLGRGEIVVRGPMVMRGYYKNPDATKKVLDDKGWFSTGDIGRVDRRGYVFLTGRSKNLIVTEGGKNVYPEEIEEKFELYDELEQVLVRGFLLDKANKAEGIELLVYINPELELGQERLDAIVMEVNRSLLPYQRVNRVTRLTQPLEMTTTKKIKRHLVG